jgi:hypothetical protein
MLGGIENGGTDRRLSRERILPYLLEHFEPDAGGK